LGFVLWGTGIFNIYLTTSPLKTTGLKSRIFS